MAPPPGTTGSLGPAFASARPVRLTVRRASALALAARFPTVLSPPWGASVTLWEATAPVKLPTCHCPPAGFTASALEPSHSQGGISTSPPPRLAPRVLRLPPILHRLRQSSMTGYSKGSRGLFVYSREASIFTGTTVSPGLSRRQRPSRYAIRAGRNLPDKEFRSVVLRPRIGGSGEAFRFRSPLRVATQLGPYHPPVEVTGRSAYGL